MHKTQSDLTTALNDAAQHVEVGGLYYHYKNSSDTYKVLQLAVTEWDDEICVLYQAQYGDRITFVRPLESWLSTVEYDGKTVSRFTTAN